MPKVLLPFAVVAVSVVGIASPAHSQPTMTAHFIDVGQGDATLLEFPCGAVLIDAGGHEEDPLRAVGYLAHFFATQRPDLNRTLNSVIITHNHIDHTSGLREVVETFNVERFFEHGKRGGYRPGDFDVDWVEDNASSLGIDYFDIDDSTIQNLPHKRGLTDGDIDPIACSGIDPEIRILSADLNSRPTSWSSDEYRDKNNHSLVVRVDFGDSSFLFTGDLEDPAIELLLDYYDGTSMLNVDVYQVGHHGSDNGTTVPLVEAMRPEVAVFSASNWLDRRDFTGYQHGHPRSGIVTMLQNAISRQRAQSKQVRTAWGVRDLRERTMRDAIYATGWDGTVKITADEQGNLSVETER